ncbi:type VI secretion system protein TssA [Trinickia terrae]|uniref:Type VI secretion system protein TssA n=1 Tax=Trinickia terrae TaxID=2571161 RepID=A0A4U1I3C4_9BURK|nr:type VI secretion system protein TssA [Trinickia terrae]TKC87729.1 type VI secretion system protein TssA [Trinickia terrae]
MSTPYSLDTQPDFTVDAESYLAALPDGDGAGESLRGDALYARIRAARHEDDASLPMGDWERPLARADWKTVAALSGDALQTRSKDFQLAAWLCEAWTHLHHVDGFVAGVEVMTGLVERYWETAWPQLEDGDAEVRAAPFAWFARNSAQVLSLHVPLMQIDVPDDLPALNLEAFQRLAAAPAGDGDGGGAVTRELIDLHVMRGDNLAALARLQERAGAAREAWERMSQLVDIRLGDYAPSFNGVAEVLTRLSRAATSLIGGRAVHVPPAVEARDEAHGEEVSGEDAQAAYVPMQPHSASHTTAGTLPHSIVDLITDRSHAYRLLADVTRYLRRQEPHSPTSYLLERAISWESMSPADLMRDIVQPDGSVERYFLMLGLE